MHVAVHFGNVVVMRIPGLYRVQKAAGLFCYIRIDRHFGKAVTQRNEPLLRPL
jgi:hypothetical protein